MAYCYECGEQIAENDVFCPYCGITIQPVAIAGLEDDDSFSKTIVASAPVAKSPVAAPPAPVAESDDAALKERLAVEAAAENKKDDFFDDVTSENIDVKAKLAESFDSSAENQAASIKNQFAAESVSKQETDDSFGERYQAARLSPDAEIAKEDASVAAPEISERFDSAETPKAERFPTAFADEKAAEPPPPNSDSLDAKPAANLGVNFEFSLKEKEENEVVADDEAGDADDAAVSQTESSLMSYEEAEVKEFSSFEEQEKWVEETAASAADEKAVEAPAPPPVSNLNKFDAEPELPVKYPDAIESDAVENLDSAEKPEAAPIENPPIAAAPISKPEIELPAADNCPPSRFDSVSIMEKKAEPFSSISTGSPLNLPPLPAAENSNESKEVGGSFTAPISASGDTGGKNKQKLKPLDEGTVLNNRYEIIRKIGGGGMGAVYLCSDKNLGGVLRAVKEMVQSYIENEQQEKAVNDFKRESLLLTSLDHQSIPTIYDYFFDESEARFYLVMKYISGGDLSSRLRSAPESRIDEGEVTAWAIQIADVLAYLHNRQPPIVYRDLKPANIMVDGNSGRVMLIDFGIARWVNKEEKGVTAVGTMGYAPPELFSGNVEARSDIYSLGSTMFHLLTGADPQSNPLLIFDFQKHPRPRQINPQLSDQMERILMRAVEYSADKRFASAAELKQALEEHQENLKAGRATFGVKEAPASVALSDQPVFCGFCGQKIVATDMFCAFCGSKQPLAQQGVHSGSYSPAPLTAQLLIIGTNELEQPAFRLEKEDNLVGRRDPMSNIFPEVDLSKFDPQTKISRRHARIWREGNEFMVEDLGSSNGTYLLPVVSDSKRLQPRQPQLLTNGDKLRLGDTTLHFILG